MITDYSIRTRMSDNAVSQITTTNIGAYIEHFDGDFVIHQTSDRAVFDRWVKEVKAAGIWYETATS